MVSQGRYSAPSTADCRRYSCRSARFVKNKNKEKIREEEKEKIREKEKMRKRKRKIMKNDCCRYRKIPYMVFSLAVGVVGLGSLWLQRRHFLVFQRLHEQAVRRGFAFVATSLDQGCFRLPFPNPLIFQIAPQRPWERTYCTATALQAVIFWLQTVRSRRDGSWT